MTKQTLLFGNGLGRSFDNDFYSLERALNTSWDAEDVLDDNQRTLICNCLDDDLLEGDLKAPTAEEDLRDLQRVLNACDTIKSFEEKIGTGDEGWLNGHGRQFPVAIRKYFHHAATQFHSADKRLPNDFANDLRAFVREARPNIATLNYDDLLYECFTETDIFNQHMLRDGFFQNFDIATHTQYYDANTEGWFLHLHGSPLFVTRNGVARKLLRAQLNTYMGTNSVHLVLTNAKSKPSVIANSTILSAYWKKLAWAFSQPCQLTLVGYGGGDLHLNKLIRDSKGMECVRVVCRNADDSKENQEEHWKNTLRLPAEVNLECIFVDDILDFDKWKPA
ncbi:MAG: hypothetical protein JJ868_14680 [Shimia sp.]|uniref:hypothetical protein n=1 Tax=Shimia sp. TaxID=1954381 RepID=UPI001B035E63|nr:hypothetical protein [Shimia sp.]MBO6898615.1 hypothetical protein [Shimia sp.]